MATAKKKPASRKASKTSARKTEAKREEENREHLGVPQPSEELADNDLPLAVDAADVPEGSGKGEVGPLVLPGMWVKISQKADVDEVHHGTIGVIEESPWTPAAAGADTGDKPTIHSYVYDDRLDFVVRTRDAANALIRIPAADMSKAFLSIAQDRSGIENYA